MKNWITIDGSLGEGGGQILRTSLALSLTTRKPFRILRIRGGRERAGLLRRHLTALKAAAQVGQARVSGAEIGSSEVTFEPQKVSPGRFHFSIGAAGSGSLVLQTVLPALMTASAPSEVVLVGGTHNHGAPPFDFLEKTFVPFIRKMGPQISCSLERSGYYPAGGGLFTVNITPVSELATVNLLERGEIMHYSCRAIVAQLDRQIGEREVKTVCDQMAWNLECCRLVEDTSSEGPGNVVFLEIASGNITEVFTGFGIRGVMSEKVAEGVADEVKRYLKARVPVGVYLADQILIPMALAGGGSFMSVAPSRHTLANIKVIESFLDVRIKRDRIEEDVWQLSILGKNGV